MRMRRLRLPHRRKRQQRRNRLRFSADPRAARHVEREFRRYLDCGILSHGSVAQNKYYF